MLNPTNPRHFLSSSQTPVWFRAVLKLGCVARPSYNAATAPFTGERVFKLDEIDFVDVTNHAYLQVNNFILLSLSTTSFLSASLLLSSPFIPPLSPSLPPSSSPSLSPLTLLCFLPPFLSHLPPFPPFLPPSPFSPLISLSYPHTLHSPFTFSSLSRHSLPTFLRSHPFRPIVVSSFTYPRTKEGTAA